MIPNQHNGNSNDVKRIHPSPYSTIQYRSNSSNPTTPTTPNNPNQLDLNYKSLNLIPQEVFLQNENAEKISLAYNQLTSLSSQFQIFQSLVNLNLRSNQFREFPIVLTQLDNLQVLDISRNKIKTLPSNPGNLINLTRFNLSKNRLHTLPLYFGRMDKLEILKIESNPFVFPSEKWFRYERWSDRTSWLKALQNHLRETEFGPKEHSSHTRSSAKNSSPLLSQKQLPSSKIKPFQENDLSPRDQRSFKPTLSLDKPTSIRKNSSTSTEYSHISPKGHSRSLSQDSINNLKYSMSPEEYNTHLDRDYEPFFAQNMPPFTSTMKNDRYKPIPRQRSNSHISAQTPLDLIIHESNSIDEIDLKPENKRQQSDLTDPTHPTDSCSSDEEIQSPHHIFSSVLNTAFSKSFDASEISRLQAYRDLLYVAHIMESRLHFWLLNTVNNENALSPGIAITRSPISESSNSLTDSNILTHSSLIDSQSDKQRISSNDSNFNTLQILRQFKNESRRLCHLLLKCTVASDDLSNSYDTQMLWNNLHSISLTLITNINQLISILLNSLILPDSIETAPQRWKDTLFTLHQIVIHLKSVSSNLQIKGSESTDKMDIVSILDKVPQQRTTPKVRPFHRKQLSENSLLSKRNINFSPLNKGTKNNFQKPSITISETLTKSNVNNHLYLSVEMGVSAAFKVLNSLKDFCTNTKTNSNGKLDNLFEFIQRCQEATQSLVGCLNMLFEVPSPNSSLNRHKEGENLNLADPAQLPRFYSHAQHFVQSILTLLQEIKVHTNEINLSNIQGMDQLGLLLSSTKEIAQNLPSK